MSDGRIKVGDWVVGNGKAGRYAITRPGTLWEVVEVQERDDEDEDVDDIRLAAISDDSIYIERTFWVFSPCFDVYDKSFADLQEGTTGYFRFEHTGSKGTGVWEFTGRIITISGNIPRRDFSFKITKPLQVPQSALDHPDKPVVLSERKLVEMRAELKQVDLLEYLMKGE